MCFHLVITSANQKHKAWKIVEGAARFPEATVNRGFATKVFVWVFVTP